MVVIIANILITAFVFFVSIGIIVISHISIKIRVGIGIAKASLISYNNEYDYL